MKHVQHLMVLAACAVSLMAPLAAHAHGDAHGDAHKGHAGHAGHAATPAAASQPRAFDSARVKATAFGQEGNPAKVSRTIQVAMGDNMRFTPATLTVRKGETVRLRATNRGAVLHELVLGTPKDLAEHAEMMRKHPGMAHDSASMAHVKPGASGDIVWQFTQAGEFQFACLLPGHFEAGMIGKVVVK